MSSSERFSKLNIVIRPPMDKPLTLDELNLLEGALHAWARDFFPILDGCFTIQHFEDIAHIHCVIIASSKYRHTFNKYLLSLACYLKEIIPLRDFMSALLQLKPVMNDIGSIRYLCHLDDEDKVLYNIDDITSSGRLAPSLLRSAFTCVPVYAVNDLIDLCENCCYDLKAIAHSLGIANYNKYRNLIRDLKYNR